MTRSRRRGLALLAFAALLALAACAQPPHGTAQIRDDTRNYDVPDRGMKDSRAP